MIEQITSNLLMVRPIAFGFNPETAEDNVFQASKIDLPQNEINQKAQIEFDTYVEKLKNFGVIVHVHQDTIEPHTPDSIFPNNWVGFEGNNVVIFPMMAKNRQQERNFDLIKKLKPNASIEDWTHYEREFKFLEGTGSIVYDRKNNSVYACISDRMHPQLLQKYCNERGLKPIIFKAFVNNKACYHTNVVMSIGEDFILICIEAIEPSDRLKVIDEITKSGKKIIEISLIQVLSFCGNILQVKNIKGEKTICMSTKAFNAFNKEQIQELEKHGNIIHSDLNTIETYGGGGARCMMSEIF